MPTAATIAAVGSTTICSGNGVLLNSSEAVGNQWFLNGAGIFMATNQTHTAVIPGTYTVVIGNGACKSPVSNSVLITGGAIAGFGVNNYNQEECAATPNNFVFTSNAPTANKKYSWDFGDSTTANTINTTHHYTALGNYIVKQIVTDTITGCKDSTTRTVYVSGCGVTSGGGGGVETQPLGDIIAQRLFGNAINSINPETDYNKTPKYISHSGTIINGGNKLKLADIIPQTVANTTNSLVSTPTDLLAFTNAIDILSVDYLSNNSCKAVALGTQTIGNVYGHTKPICDRLKDAQLLEVKKVNIAGFDVIASKLKQRNGLYEFCINFSIGVNQNDTALRLQSNWLTDHYKQQDTMFNFQLWSVSYNMTTSIAEQVINKLKTYKSIKALASNVNDIPKAFIQSVKREKNMLELTIVNPTNYTTGNFEIVEKANELSTAYNKTIAFTIAANTTSIIKLNVADVYENNIYMNLSNNNADMVYMTDGGWSVDYDKTTTTLNKFTVTNAPVTIVDNEYPLFRKVKVDATSKSYVSAFKLVKGGGIERDFSKFKTLQFNANGVGTTTLKITLIKQGITNWDNQYTYTLPIDATATNYIISLNKFISKASNLPINLNDITAINFTWENTRGINANIGGTIANVKFATQEAIIAQIINDNEIGIYPNPSNGKFKVAFNSDAAKPLVIKLVDIYTGRTIYNQFVTAKKGMNNYEVILKDFFTSNLYVLSIEGDDVKYIPRKVVIQNSK